MSIGGAATTAFLAVEVENVLGDWRRECCWVVTTGLDQRCVALLESWQREQEDRTACSRLLGCCQAMIAVPSLLCPFKMEGDVGWGLVVVESQDS